MYTSKSFWPFLTFADSKSALKNYLLKASDLLANTASEILLFPCSGASQKLL